ncbi:Protein phosphatase 1 regulatory subunit 42 [Oopsacas minuta]|uniref:Protein phosphatase 1 regulatory subunit 42 n=1 Tax=Oopsacas minuta TaxID=111878 RepID=A0AAV7KH01_9METZ|nr:Protein phosphatase 1 regulatory subunit 42 [Oopsacas minuta]
MASRLTPEFLAQRTNRWNRKRGEMASEYLRRVTHLFLSEHNLSNLVGIEVCTRLSVLYLYDNSIREIHNLEFAHGLTHLYLQNNFISKLEGLLSLNNLTKLYLGGNLITVLEGMENLKCLKELHIESQKLDPGEKLLFDPLSLRAISPSLLILNISNNHIDTLQELTVLNNLDTLFCTNNILFDLVELVNFVNRMLMLCNLDLRNNPVCKRIHYRENTITHSSLRQLDGKDIPDSTRLFLHKLHYIRESRKKQFVRQTTSTTPKRHDSKMIVTPYLALHPSYRLYDSNSTPPPPDGLNNNDD